MIHIILDPSTLEITKAELGIDISLEITLCFARCGTGFGSMIDQKVIFPQSKLPSPEFHFDHRKGHLVLL